MLGISRRLIPKAPVFLQQQLHKRDIPHPLRTPLWALAPLGIFLGSLEWAHAKDSDTVPQTQDSSVPYVNSDKQSQLFPESLHQINLDKVISNDHTARWRVYTDMGRDLFSKGRLAESESYFLQALEEAKKGFGDNDPHVASSCNNLAELFRMKKEFDKAESLYLEAIKRLEQAMGSEHESVGFALHNLGGLYLLQRNLEKAHECYEINGKRLGVNHPEYANTMFHLGEVLRIMGKSADAEALVRDSVRVLEMLVHSNQLQEAENLQRKIVHILDMAEGPEASSTVRALENLASTLLMRHKLDEAEELFRRCLEIKQKVSQSHSIQLWGPLFKLASIALEKGDALARQSGSLGALAEYEKAEALLQQALSIADRNWEELCAASATGGIFKRDNRFPVSIQPFHTQGFLALVRSLATIGLVGVSKLELPGFPEKEPERARAETEAALQKCRTLVKKPECAELSSLPVVRKEYAKCLQHLVKLQNISKYSTEEISLRQKEIQQLLKEVSSIDAEISR
ncbi:hypothetical protein O6H91_01G145400 [Diphasiastrum complanatum]|uniref:Uncharacterized protein n=1 Tax=Diphasiastrum complanatum TaxID=34168 RepID=A0ACC2EX22_DIPCM|nr:hypothetical protein O6H91_01G145400 [Diphasiastrum complanatum]